LTARAALQKTLADDYETSGLAAGGASAIGGTKTND
jgi:hypothetical protein